MSAEVLRRAAALMRERAEGATPGPWFADQTRDAEPIIKRAKSAPPDHNRCGFGIVAAPSYGAVDYGLANAEHIASWHPAVALAVADWLNTAGADLWAHGPLCCDNEHGCDECDGILWMQHVRRALAVARAHLGSEFHCEICGSDTHDALGHGSDS